MPVKKNQPRLFAQIAEWFQDHTPENAHDFRTTSQTDRGHGRLEQRLLQVTTDLNEHLTWPDVQQVLQLTKTTTDLKRGLTKTTIRYAITSLPPDQADATQLLKLWREHWAIENQLHYPRDVFFREDASRIQDQSVQTVLATLRSALLTLLNLRGYTHIKFARQYYAARPTHAFGLINLQVHFLLE